MKLKQADRKVVARLMQQHEGLDIVAGADAGKTRTMAYPVSDKGRVSWWKQVAMTSPGESGRRHHWAAVVRANRPANATAIVQSLLD